MVRATLWGESIGVPVLIRAVLPIAPLLNAAVQDFKRRELDASAWVPILVVGIVFLVVELAASSNTGGIVARLVITLTTLLLPYFLHLYKLGDAIVMIGLSLTHVSTTKPILGGFLLTALHPDFGLTVLWNTEIIMLLLTLLEAFCKASSRGLKRGAASSKATSEEASPIPLWVGRGKIRRFFRREAPLVSFLLPGYVVTILFGSLVPLPFQA